jgi:hypothetical protein
MLHLRPPLCRYRCHYGLVSPMRIQIFVLNACLDVKLNFSWTNTTIGISFILQVKIKVSFSVIFDYHWEVTHCLLQALYWQHSVYKIGSISVGGKSG